MATDYRVRSIVGQNQWEGKYGPMKDYELFVEGADAPNATVTLTQKPETAAPQEGQTIFGHIEETGRGMKLKKDQREGAPQQSSNGASGQDEYARRPDHPDNVARMRHTAAMSAAPGYYELLRTEGVIPKAESKAAALETLRGLIQWIENGYPTAGDELPFS